ncbi:MAG: AAA-like domain-containing protein, partial [Cyanobacteria bacterium P01_D01_bin.56]
KPGSLLRVKAPRQMGKTSLITRILAHAADQGAQTVCWDLMELDRNTLDNLETFLKSLCWQVTRQLGLEDQLSKYWKGPVSNNQKCSIYFSEYILPQVENFLVLGIDDVDRVFPYHHTAPDALSLLRIWHQNGNKLQSPWNKLRLVLAHSTEEYAQLDQNHSPFNVGVSIALPEFSLLQLQELSNRHGLTWETRYSDGRAGSHALQSLYKVVGGHPYLVRRAFFELARGNIELEKLLHKASTDEGIYSDHLRRHWTVLNKSSALSDAMKKVVMSPEPQVLNPGVKFQLNSMGVVKLQDNCALPRCQLYRTYFSQTL